MQSTGVATAKRAQVIDISRERYGYLRRHVNVTGKPCLVAVRSHNGLKWRRFRRRKCGRVWVTGPPLEGVVLGRPPPWWICRSTRRPSSQGQIPSRWTPVRRPIRSRLRHRRRNWASPSKCRFRCRPGPINRGLSEKPNLANGRFRLPGEWRSKPTCDRFSHWSSAIPIARQRRLCERHNRQHSRSRQGSRHGGS